MITRVTADRPLSSTYFPDSQYLRCLQSFLKRFKSCKREKGGLGLGEKKKKPIEIFKAPYIKTGENAF